jgi:hypothetical protein
VSALLLVNERVTDACVMKTVAREHQLAQPMQDIKDEDRLDEYGLVLPDNAMTAASEVPVNGGGGPNTQPKRITLSGAYPELAHYKLPSVWARFQVDRDRCKARFAKLAKLPEWGGGPWQDLYGEAFQV